MSGSSKQITAVLIKREGGKVEITVTLSKSWSWGLRSRVEPALCLHSVFSVPSLDRENRIKVPQSSELTQMNILSPDLGEEDRVGEDAK